MSRPYLVLALEQAVAAPLCSRKLADFGARVIKVERPDGDFARNYDRVANGESAYFVWLNRGKESISLNLRREEDVRLLSAMAGQADIFVQNTRPGTLEGIGIDLTQWRSDNPRLITCSITGYSPLGPNADRKAYDLLIQAECGLASITGSPDEPARVGVSVVDIAAGVTAYEAILEAIIRRETSRVGEHIEVSLFGAICDWMTVPLLHAKYGRAPARVGLLHPSIAPYGLYRCSDQLEILIGIQNEREWVAFCDVVLHAKDAASLPIFLDNSLRVQNRASLDELIGKIVRTLSSTELRQRLERADIAYGFLNDLAAVLRHAEVGALDVTTASGVVSMPAAIGYRQGAQDGTLSSVPALNQQGESIRSEFAPFTRAVMKDH